MRGRKRGEGEEVERKKRGYIEKEQNRVDSEGME